MTTSTTRRHFLTRLPGLALAGAVALGLAPHPAAAAKRSKQQARYQPSPRNGQTCDGCVHFLDGNKCRLVAGDINPDGWCMFFTPKG